MIDEEGYCYVNELTGNCLSIFDPQGNKIHTVGKLNGPRGVMLDPKSGSLYVANCGAKTVLSQNALLPCRPAPNTLYTITTSSGKYKTQPYMKLVTNQKQF